MISYNTIILLCAILTGNCTSRDTSVNHQPGDSTQAAINEQMRTHLTTKNFVGDIVRHPAFKGFGDLLLPLDDNSSYYNTRIENIASLMPYHNAVNSEEIVKSVNQLIDDASKGKTIFYSFYNDNRKNKIPQKIIPGCFFIAAIPVRPSL